MARTKAAAGLDAYQTFDFLRGLDIKTSPLKLALLKAQNALVRSENAVYDTSGGVSKRRDTEPVTTGQLGGQRTAPYLLTNGLGEFGSIGSAKLLPTLGFLGTGAPAAITGGTQFVKADGTRIVVFGTDDGRLLKVRPDQSTEVLASGFTPETRWYFEQVFTSSLSDEILIVCNRADAPRKYDGTTVSVLGGSPPTKGGPVRARGKRLFFLDADAPHDFVWSALNNPEDYTSPTNAGRATTDSRLLDLIPSINEMILLGDDRPYRLQGTSPSTFTLANVVPTTGSVGGVSTTGGVFAVNQVWYLSSVGLVTLQGVQQFGDLSESFPSDRISPYWEPDSGVTLSLNQLHRAVLTYDPQWNRLYLLVDTDNDAENDTVLVYDLNAKAWSVWTGVPAASLWTVQDPDTGITEVWAGGYDGVIRALNRHAATTAIPCRVSHLSCLDQPGVEKSLRHLFLYLKEQGNYNVDVTTKFDFGAAGGQVYTASLLGGSKTLGVNWVLGVDPLGKRDQIVKRIDTHGTGEFVEVTVANTHAGEPFTWYGYEAISRPRRVVRRGTAAG